jgi:GTP-binding protein EngB required for normal cell division
LRTSPRTKVDVTIQASSFSSKRVESFNETRFDKDELPQIIEAAKRTMLVNSIGFSEDVLKVEICGPDLPHLTLVDLPGFYHSEDDNQSAAGREIVDRLVERYMAKKNRIILAIISARNQFILQKVLPRVKVHDKDRARTLGIITKPDMLKTGSQDEYNFVKLTKTWTSQMSYPWAGMCFESVAKLKLRTPTRRGILKRVISFSQIRGLLSHQETEEWMCSEGNSAVCFSPTSKAMSKA